MVSAHSKTSTNAVLLLDVLPIWCFFCLVSIFSAGCLKGPTENNRNSESLLHTFPPTTCRYPTNMVRNPVIPFNRGALSLQALTAFLGKLLPRVLLEHGLPHLLSLRSLPESTERLTPRASVISAQQLLLLGKSHGAPHATCSSSGIPAPGGSLPQQARGEEHSGSAVTSALPIDDNGHFSDTC